MTDLQTYANSHPLLKLIPAGVDPEVFTESLFHQLQPHIPSIIKANTTHSVAVDPAHIDLYAGDFYGYLKRYHPSVPYELMWLSCRVSGMNGPNDFDKRYTQIYLITDSTLLQRVTTAKKAVQKSGI